MKQFGFIKASFVQAHFLEEFDSAIFDFPFFANVNHSQLKCLSMMDLLYFVALNSHLTCLNL